jgi:alpha-1,2-mannosyltransferase
MAPVYRRRSRLRAMWGRLLLVLGIVAHLAFGLRPAWEKVTSAPSARDFASYYYAVQVAADGGDPYETSALDRAARADHTRKGVHPYFYPPPFLLAMTWALPLPLSSAYLGMLLLNELLLLGVVTVCIRSFNVAPWAAGLLLAAYSPIPDNAWMGQANLLALFPMLLGLAVAGKRPVAGGVLVGMAGMLKMSPALFLVYWVIQGRWRPVLAAMATAVGLSLLTLPLVGLDAQLRFYTEVLPGFPKGDYHGLTVPITLPANHSIPDLLNAVWPGPTRFRLSETAQAVGTAITLAMLAVWAYRFRGPPARDPDPGAVAALTVLMVITPVYTYEHHLVFLLPAVGVVLTRRAGPVVWLAAAMLACPLDWVRAAQSALPWASAFIKEGKFVAELVVFWAALRGSTRA